MLNKQHILTLLAASVLLPASAAITGQWRQHPSFDNSILQVIDTPERTYFMGYPQSVNPSIPFKASPDCTLFYYDKEGDEIVPAAQRLPMATTTVRSMSYNPDKGYLLVIYDNQDIDLLHDDGSISNIGAIRNATLPGSKNVNSVTFDPAHDLVWLATDFGYVALNDEHLEVAESRNYGVPLTSVGRIADNLYLSDGETLYKASLNTPRMRLDEYTVTTEFPASVRLYTLGDKVLRIDQKEENNYYVATCTVESDGSLKPLTERDLTYISQVLPSKEGYVLNNWSAHVLVRSSNGSMDFIARPEEEKGRKYGATWDFKTLYTGLPRKGLRSFTLNSDKKFELSRDFMLPNAPNAYLSRNMLWHPRYGMIVNTYGSDVIISNNSTNEPNLMAGLKDGVWSPLSPTYLNPEQAEVGMTPVGMVTDPDDDRYVYQGSSFSGLTRYNLDDPTDIIHYSHPADANASLPGYVKFHDTHESWSRNSTVTDPTFDADGNLWVLFYDYTNRDSRIEFRYQTPADRRASTNAASARPWQTLTKNLSGISHLTAKFLPLKASVNRNLLFYMSPYGVVVIDHNGTPDNGADDKVMTITKLTDQDGNALTNSAPAKLWEDPQTGVVWIAGPQGLFYCTPRNLLQGQGVLNRVKVSRNDGTSLADYLLNGVEITGIEHDAEGRMWIATSGAGVVVTSGDGKRIYQEFTSETSDLPSNIVYNVAYNPSTRSMMFSTAKGLCEFFIGGTDSGAQDAGEVRAYPNPVAPDYYGWVTIDGLPDNSLVKIVDTKGHLVRELGRAEGGSIQWDVNNLHYRRVQTGVYYILVSPGTDAGGESRVGKILVMN
ncbi:MAG: T9SS type A sorting domain-containing protein [Muribaculaceae bacterium]|nr:T9SS type A sorting domain-containing protein [Muribaculaceae bacterium]